MAESSLFNLNISGGPQRAQYRAGSGLVDGWYDAQGNLVQSGGRGTPVPSGYYASAMNPIGGFGSGGSQPASPELKEFYLNQEPTAGFYSYLQGQGLLGTDPVAKFAQQQFGNLYGRYSAAAADDPALGFYQFLNNTGPNLRNQFFSQAPEQRGDFTSRFLTPRARFLGVS